MKTKDIYIIGVGGFAKEVVFLINSINKHQNKFVLKGFINVDDSLSSIKVEGTDYPVYSETYFLSSVYSKETHLAMGIGAPKILLKLSEVFNKESFPNLIHPNVEKGSSVTLGFGNIVTSGCILTVDIKIGDFNIFNLNTTVGHDTEILNANVFNPGVNISGGCVIDSGNLFGTNCTVLQNLSIGQGNIIGASALLTKSFNTKGLLVGIPAKDLKNK